RCLKIVNFARLTRERLCIPACPYEINEAGLAGLKFDFRQSTSKQLMAQPEAIGVDDIALAVLGDLADVSVPIVFLDLCAADSVRLSRQAHHTAQLVQRRLALGAERG